MNVTVLGARVAATKEPARPSSAVPRVLVWGGDNTSTIFVARAFAQKGWAVDWLGFPSVWQRSHIWSRRTVVSGYADPALEHAFATHPLDALLLHGDDQVRWMLSRWGSLSGRVRAHLPAVESLELALSKHQSAARAQTLGVPVLETVLCRSRREVAEAGARLAVGRQVVLKGEGGAGGSGVVALDAGVEPSDAQWRRVTAHSPSVMVQKRVHGPRVLVTVAYEHGVERAACMHEKLITYPRDFGPAAFGVTRRIDILHEYTARIFGSLGWHGIADIEFRQDVDNGAWHFMEINPRVCATLGIEAQAGMDLVGAWARVCAGRGAEDPPGRNYRDGVRYAWGARALAAAIRRPWAVRPWEVRTLASPACDLQGLEPPLRTHVLRTAFWMARHG